MASLETHNAMVRKSFAFLLTVLAWFVAALAPGAADAQAIGSLVVRGRVLAAGPEAADGLRVRVDAGVYADSAEVGPDGGFRLTVPRPARLDSVEVWVDAAEAARRAYHPALVRVAIGDAGEALEIVLVPRRWTIVQGRYAGREVEIELERAFGGGFYRWAPGGGARAIAGWPEARFPLRVAFDRELSGEPVAARDSAAFWGAVGKLEEVFGEKLFRPASSAEVAPREDGGPDDAILVWIDPTLREFVGYSTTGSSRGDIAYGDLRLRRGALQDAGSTGLVLHELMHTLGFGHTCAWRSVLVDVRRCPLLRTDLPTAEDVAYVQVAGRVRELERAGRARRGMEAALAGERSLRDADRLAAAVPASSSPPSLPLSNGAAPRP